MRFDGKAAVVTGAGRGIGFEIAKLLMSEGAQVVLIDVDQDAADDAAGKLRELGGLAEPIACDVTDPIAVQGAMQKCVERFGRLDVLVNNAGVTKDAKLTDLDADAWDFVLDVNLKGAFLCSQAAAKHMIPAGYGRIVNISSIAYDGNVGTANYSASKGGVNALTRTACLELARYGITINAVAPGAVATRLALDLPQKVQEKFLSKIPCHRWAAPSEIASVVAFLASDDAAYINGQIIHVCGGLTVGYL